ncbi:MAG TPA: glycosyltransferase family A protein [Chitinophagaceae bacterium]|nr:glycosyltransferase family A protein [Chitinophagaceae bacterium]
MISIITPTYNRETLLLATINSILKQSFTDWELIVVDDGSTDGTENMMQKYLADDRIRYIKKNNTGQAHSLNFGVSYARGAFITFLDSDDEAHSNWLEVVNSRLKENTGMACTGAWRKFQDGKVIKEDLIEYDLFGDKLRLKFTCGSLFINREVFNIIGGYDSSMKSNIQTDLGYRLVSYLVKTNLKIESIDDNLIQINIHSGPRIRTNWVNRNEGAIQFLNKHYQFLLKNSKKDIANLCSTIAFSSYKLKDRKTALYYLAMAIRFSPFRMINYLRVVKYLFV